MNPLVPRFLEPSAPSQRQYEALRAHVVDGLPAAQAAARFGYSLGTFRNLLSAFRRDPDYRFFVSNRAGPKPSGSKPSGIRRDRRIVELRRQGHSTAEIENLIRAEGLPASAKTIQSVLGKNGFGKLRRRSAEQLDRMARPSDAPAADRRLLDLSPRQFRTAFGGLFLLLPLLARFDLDRVLADHSLPSSAALPAGCAVRSLLALKLWGVSRGSLRRAQASDPGIALFAGLNFPSKRAALSEYSCQVDSSALLALAGKWIGAAHRLGLPSGESFDLDFHRIPCHGDEAVARRRRVSKLSRRQKGLLALVVRDADARVICHVDASVRREDRRQTPLRFAEDWKRRTGAYPRELVFDGEFTTQAILGRLDRLGIGFVTPQRRTKQLVARLGGQSTGKWRQVTLNGVGRGYGAPRVIDELTRLGTYPEPIRRLAVAGLGQEGLVVLVTNQLDVAAARLVETYVGRMLAGSRIADEIDFFHMDALSASVPLKVGLDLHATLMASGLYRMLATQLGQGHELASAPMLFRTFIDSAAQVCIEEERIHVRFARRAGNPELVRAGFADVKQPIPWLGDKQLQLVFG